MAPALSKPEPISIGRYQVDGDSQTWKYIDNSELYQDIFQGHTIVGSNDWAYKHNRLTNPGSSKMTVKFMIPASMIKMNYPDATIILRAAYFGPWNMSPCTVSLKLNNV